MFGVKRLVTGTRSTIANSGTFPTTRSSTTFRVRVQAQIHSSRSLEAGHNRWSKIRHDKGKNDRERANEYSKLVRAVTEAVKQAGPTWEADMRAMNAIAAAKKAKLPKEKLENAIKKGQGISLEGKSLQPVIIECMAPGQVAIVIECHTDNTRRTMQEILLIIKKNNAAQTPVMFLFERKGVILLDAPETEVDNIMMEAADLEGVEDVFYRQPDEDGEKGAVEIRVEPEATAAIATAIKNHSGIPFDVIKAGIEVIPNEDTLTDGPTGDKDCADLSKLLEQLEESDDVTELYTNLRK